MTLLPYDFPSVENRPYEYGFKDEFTISKEIDGDFFVVGLGVWVSSFVRVLLFLWAFVPSNRAEIDLYMIDLHHHHSPYNVRTLISKIF